MRKSLLFSLLTAVVFFACRKEDNPSLPENLERVPLPQITKSASTDAVISFQNVNAFKGTVVVDLFFKNDVKPKMLDVVIIKNGNPASVKMLQANVTTFPTSINITGPQLASLFGAPIALGDKYDIGADITTQSGKKFQAFPATGVGYAVGVTTQPGSSPFVRYEAVCKFNAPDYAGDFTVVVDEWEDYHPGDVIKVTVVSPTQLSFNYATSINAKPIIVDVDPLTNATSVKKQAYGNYGTVDNFSAESVPGLDNFVAPCEGIISVLLNHTSQRGNFGNYLIKLKKKS